MQKFNIQPLVLDTVCPLTSTIIVIIFHFSHFHSQRRTDFFAKNIIISVTETRPSFCHVFTADRQFRFKQTCGYCNLCPMAMRTCALLHYQAKRPLRHLALPLQRIPSISCFRFRNQIYSQPCLALIFSFFHCAAVLSFCPLIHLSTVLFFFCLQYHQWVCVASESRAQAVPHEGAHPVTHS